MVSYRPSRSCPAASDGRVETGPRFARTASAAYWPKEPPSTCNTARGSLRRLRVLARVSVTETYPVDPRKTTATLELCGEPSARSVTRTAWCRSLSQRMSASSSTPAGSAVTEGLQQASQTSATRPAGPFDAENERCAAHEIHQIAPPAVAASFSDR